MNFPSVFFKFFIVNFFFVFKKKDTILKKILFNLNTLEVIILQ